MAVLSISSQVSMGHVGNSATAFALQRLGHEVWQIPTTILSHHPGHGRPAGTAIPTETVSGMMDSVLSRSQPQAVFSGYLAAEGNGVTIADRLTRLRASGTEIAYILDPVIGDTHSGQYVADAILHVIRNRLLPLANICLPNRFELSTLSGIDVTGTAACRKAAEKLLTAGPRMVLCTSAPATEGRVANELHTADNAWRIEMSAIPDAPHGTGDLFAGVFMAKWLEGAPPQEAMGYAAGAVHAVAGWSRAMRMDDLALTASQHVLGDPPALPDIETLPV